ncbi:hypothetical protein Rhe02_69390 [Rhizocola hellebori]|uniref:Protein kinase domain-containing protein n=1 Tax=Rhizocola hellebori TaxID=1392758 RepID=A0A8J3QFV4_9ACTN|nr:serine/threonine-protein kinase [Rhizocola hellebori]GIH08872.1 hypothetical protein Rhe02_69390 [Rhizocola hellebori]
MLPLGKNDPDFVASYRLLGVLGGGGMGRVYLGQSRSGKRLAIKVLSEHFAEDPEYRERFAREVAAARLVSPLYTAAVVDSDKDASSPWLATTYIDGPSLEEWVGQHGKLTSETVLALALGLAEALASIHQAGLVHRDLKPSNIIIDINGPHIIDFGIALSGDATRITTSMLVGTPSYMAPERINGVDAGPAGDIFSLGATLFYAATGSPLIKDGTFYEQVIQVALGRFELTEVPVNCQPLITRCLSKDPQDRPTAAELVQILVGIGAIQPAHGWWAEREPLPTRTHFQRPPRHSRRRLLVAGGAFGLALLGGGAAAAWSYLKRGQPGASPLPSATPSGTTRPGRSSRVLWQVASHADHGPPPAPDSLSVRVVIDRGRRIIAASGRNVLATDVLGRPVWTKEMPTSSLQLWPWDDVLLVGNLNSLWLLNAETGAIGPELNVAKLEEPFAAQDNPDGMAVQLERVLVGPDRALLSVGTALLAIDRTGKVTWRMPRPMAANGRHTPIPVPLFATQTHLVTRETATTSRVGLRQMSSGKSIWRATDSPPGPPPGPGPGGRDEAWKASEGVIVGDYLVLRESSRVQVRLLSTGKLIWHVTSPTPVVTMKQVRNLVLLAADRLVAYGLADGKPIWEKQVRGARLAVTQAGDAIVVVNENGLSIRDTTGEPLWEEPFRAAVGDLMPDQIHVDSQTAYVTFRPRDEGPPGGPPPPPNGPPPEPRPSESPGGGPNAPIDAIAYQLGPDLASAEPSPTP